MTAGTTAFAGLDPCVHCGFCLQACPTFLVTGDEADGPRGRIVLMQALARERITAEHPDLQLHIDRCLGCRGCEPVCPSGVSYAPALEETRRRIAAERPVPFIQRAVHTVMAEPLWRAAALGPARLLRPAAAWLAGRSRLGFAFGMLAATRPRGNAVRSAKRADPSPPSPTAVFAGCIMNSLFSHVHAATRRTLVANRYEVIDVKGQGCCGALHAHAGQHDAALELARRNVQAFRQSPDASIAVNSAGCGAMMKEYGRLLADDPLAEDAAQFAARVEDVTELLAERGPARGAPIARRVAYDPPCHLLHAQHVREAPEAVLHAVPETEVVRHAEAELCCGSAGSYSLVESGMSRAVLDRKVTALLETAPDVVATGNPGCVMQIGAGLRARGAAIPVVHPVELLDESYARAGLYER